MHRGKGTFDLVDDVDDVLGKQLGGTPAELRVLKVLEDGAKLLLLFRGMNQIPRETALARQDPGGAGGGAEGGAKRQKTKRSTPLPSDRPAAP